MLRKTEPELLDTLPVDHPDALDFRRDMRRINALMGNFRWFARVLPGVVHRAESQLELGAGVGELCSYLAERGHPLDGLDLWPAPPGWPPERTWHRADLVSFDGYPRYRVVLGNMIFHQFTDAAIAQLGEKLRSHARVILACEPLRRRALQPLYRLVARLAGANHVSIHDGHVSIAAGFLGDELPRLLGLKHDEWRWQCHTTLLGAYRMIAVRRSS